MKRADFANAYGVRRPRRSMRAATGVALLAILLLAGCAQAPRPAAAPQSEPPMDQPAPAPAWLHGLRESPVSSGAEPSLLADRNGKFLWIGDTSGTYSSSDNGLSWHLMTYPINVGAVFDDGVALAQDDKGTLYAAYLNNNRIDVAVSHDGQTFDAFTVGGIFDTVDRPWIGAHGDGQVALFYIDAVGPIYTAGSGHCARSTDGGKTFTDTVPLAANPQGGKAFYDQAGNFYYSQDNGAVMQFTSTCLGGGREVQLLDDLGSANNMVQADADGNDLYMAGTNGQGRIELAGRTAGGATKNLVVSPASLGASTYATVSPTKGEVAVAWYGSTTKGDPFSTAFNGDFSVYVARVQNFWSNQPNVTVVKATGVNHHGMICSEGLTCTSGRGLLDYFMADHDTKGRLHIAYVNDADGTGVVHTMLPALGAPPPVPNATDEPQSTTDEPAPTSAPPSEGAHATFTASVVALRLDADASNSTGAPPLSYAWDFGDHATDHGAAVSHQYAAAGTYTVHLAVTDATGATSSASAQVTLTSGGAPSHVTVAPTPPTTSKPAKSPGIGLGLIVALAVVGLALRRGWRED